MARRLRGSALNIDSPDGMRRCERTIRHVAYARGLAELVRLGVSAGILGSVSKATAAKHFSRCSLLERVWRVWAAILRTQSAVCLMPGKRQFRPSSRHFVTPSMPGSRRMDVPALFAPMADEDAAHAALEEAIYRWVLCTNYAAGEACRYGNRSIRPMSRFEEAAKGTCMSGVSAKRKSQGVEAASFGGPRAAYVPSGHPPCSPEAPGQVSRRYGRKRRRS